MSHYEADNSQEEWRATAGYPGYEVSDQGNVRRSDLYDPLGRLVYDSKPIARQLSGTSRDKNGNYYARYWDVSLRVAHRTQRHAKVHHLVAVAFIGPRPTGMVICHNNGDSLDNRVENLRYDTQANNIADMHLHRGGHHEGLKTECLNGHDITNPDNVYASSPGRKCKTCQRRRAKERYERLRAEREAKAS
jgi:hypothetical protein